VKSHHSPTVSQYPPDIERLNVITHGLGLLYGIGSAYWILQRAASDQIALAGTIIFVASFMLMFATSTLYHAYTDPQIKWMMKKADHISIYFMIAGSYTPFILIYYKNESGLTLLTVMWILTLLGTIFKAFTTGRYKAISTIFYVLMGMAILTVSNGFFATVPGTVRTLLLMGGMYYLIGVPFYLKKSWYYHHPVWHLFVLAGSLSHWWALWLSL